MARCYILKGIWVTKTCENAALSTCKECGNPTCAEHGAFNAYNEWYCVNCLKGNMPTYALEDYLNGEVENYVYFIASLKSDFNKLLTYQKQQGIKPIFIEKLYNFTTYDAMSFRQEYTQYYDDNDTHSPNLYDS